MYLMGPPGIRPSILSIAMYNSVVLTTAIVVLVCLLERGVVSSAIHDHLFTIDEATEAAIVIQTNRIDRLTSKFQSLMDNISSTIVKNKIASNRAKHLIDTHLKEEWCSHGRIRCGKSPQCVSGLFMCDGINDCDNHFDESSVRCESPMEENSTWIGYPSYFHCTMFTPYLVYMHITGVNTNKYYNELSYLNIQLDLTSLKDGDRTDASLPTTGSYSRSKNMFTMNPPTSDGTMMEGVFDSVDKDSFIANVIRISSRTKCGEFKFKRIR